MVDFIKLVGSQVFWLIDLLVGYMAMVCDGLMNCFLQNLQLIYGLVPYPTGFLKSKVPLNLIIGIFSSPQYAKPSGWSHI